VKPRFNTTGDQEHRFIQGLFYFRPKAREHAAAIQMAATGLVAQEAMFD
jgi:hypothetical protein